MARSGHGPASGSWPIRPMRRGVRHGTLLPMRCPFAVAPDPGAFMNPNFAYPAVLVAALAATAFSVQAAAETPADGRADCGAAPVTTAPGATR